MYIYLNTVQTPEILTNITTKVAIETITVEEKVIKVTEVKVIPKVMTSDTSDDSSPVAIIAGSVVAVVSLVAVLRVMLVCLRRCHGNTTGSEGIKVTTCCFGTSHVHHVSGRSSESGPASGQSSGHIELSATKCDDDISGRGQSHPGLISDHRESRDVGSTSAGNCVDISILTV